MSLPTKIAITAFMLGFLLQGMYHAIKSVTGKSSFPLAALFCASQLVALTAVIVALWQL